MKITNMRSRDKVECSNNADDTATYSQIPSGSDHQTCRTLFNLESHQRSTKFIADNFVSFYLTNSERKDAYVETTPLKTGSNRIYFARTLDFYRNFLHLPFHLCPHLSSETFAHFDTSRTVEPLQGLTRLTKSTAVFFICLLFVFSLFVTADSTPVHSPSSPHTRTLDVDTNNFTLSKSKFINHRKLFEVENEVTDISASVFDTQSLRVKRDSEIKKPRRKKDKGKKNRKRNKNDRANRRKKSPKKIRKISPTASLRNVIGGKEQQDTLTSYREQRLYNKNGISFHLAVTKNGKVKGEKSHKRTNYSKLEIRGVEKGGIVAIMGTATKRYICVSKKGSVRAKKTYKRSKCRFKERILANNQNTYESLSCKDCYLNINRKGRVRRLKGTNSKLIKAHFLPLAIAETRFLAAQTGSVEAIDLSNYTEAEVEKRMSPRDSLIASTKKNVSLDQAEALIADDIDSKTDPARPVSLVSKHSLKSRRRSSTSGARRVTVGRVTRKHKKDSKVDIER